ncbi:MAG: TonB-dependent receptor [Balneolaceae bacterium]
MKKSVPLIVILILLSHSRITAQRGASVEGYVTDSQSGKTLITANIAISETTAGAFSDTTGYYSLADLEPGTYTIICSYIGYRRFEQEITVDGGESTRLNIELIPENVQLGNVTVESVREPGKRRNIGISQLSSDFIRELPVVIEPDVFRSIQLLPGVKSTSDFSSGLYVRGGGPDQTLVLLDDTPLYNPTHFFGFFSIFNTDAVRDIQLYKGGYPARFGGRLGSVLTVYNKNGNSDRTQGKISMGLLASRASVESPFKRGSWMLAFRRSTLEPVMSVLRESVDMVPDLFYFYDVNGKINVDLSPDDRLSVTIYSGTDVVSVPFRETAAIRLNYGNRLLRINWRKIVSGRFYSSVSISGSNYFNQPELEIAGTPFKRDNSIYDFTVKTDMEYLPAENHTLSAGILSGVLNLKYQDWFNHQNVFSKEIQSYYLSAYVQDNLEIFNHWTLNTGVRFNTFSKGNYTRLEPRVSLEYEPFSWIRLQGAYGRYYQFMALITNEAFSGFDLWLTSDEGVPPSYGDQFMAGSKINPFDGYELDFELYYRTMRNLFELDPFVTNPAGHEYREMFRFGRGYAYGAELSFEKQTGPLTGLIGYTFGITRRKFPGFNTNLPDNPNRARFYPPRHDRTHDGNVVLNYQFSTKWSASAVFSYATGQAYTKPIGRTRFWNVPWEKSTRNTFVVENINGSRLPSYHRLDLSFSRFGTFFGLGEAEWQLQIINVYSRRNTWFYSYNFAANPAERDDIHLLPLLPSITYTLTL